MIKKIQYIILACGLAFTAVAQDNAKFGREFNVSLSSGYPLDAGFTKAYDFNFTAGAQLFVTKNIGVEVNLPFYKSNGTFFEEGSAFGLLRLPVKDTIAPYLGVGSKYNWTDKTWDYEAKAGVEVRLTKGWGVFGEYNYAIKNFNDYQNGASSLSGGIRLVF